MCVTDRHDKTLAIKVVLNPNTTKHVGSELQIYGAPAPMTQDFKKMAHDFSR